MSPTALEHPFQRAGLGVTPFRFVGCEERRGPILVSTDGGVEHWAGAPGQPMGTCAYCGQGIAICCTVQDGEGRRFIVGSDCIRKVSGGPLKRATDRALTDLRHAKEDARIAAGLAWAQSEWDRLSEMFVDGRSLASRLDWFIKNAGRAGKLRAIAECRAAIAKAEGGAA